MQASDLVTVSSAQLSSLSLSTLALQQIHWHHSLDGTNGSVAKRLKTATLKAP